jgi:hypothetical protein
MSAARTLPGLWQWRRTRTRPRRSELSGQEIRQPLTVPYTNPLWRVTQARRTALPVLLATLQGQRSLPRFRRGRISSLVSGASHRRLQVAPAVPRGRRSLPAARSHPQSG